MMLYPLSYCPFTKQETDNRMSQYLNRMYGSNPYLTCFLVSSTKIDAVVRSLFAQLKLFALLKKKINSNTCIV